jgi:hypothetical protein
MTSDGWTGGVDAMQVMGITMMTSTGSMKNGNKPFRTAAPGKNTIFLGGYAGGIDFVVAYRTVIHRSSWLLISTGIIRVSLKRSVL